MPPRNRADRSAARPEPLHPDDGFYLIYNVQDTGKGLAAEEIEHLFKRFSQANNYTHSEQIYFALKSDAS